MNQTDEIKKEYYSISEVADILCVSTHTVRQYCIDTDIAPKRRSSGERRFTEADMVKLRQIRKMMLSGMFKLTGIRQFVKLHGWRNTRFINKQIFNEL
jgi:DNA-binding transcriptional MerR regulator